MDKLADSDSFFNDLLGGENEYELLAKKSRVSILNPLMLFRRPKKQNNGAPKKILQK